MDEIKPIILIPQYKKGKLKKIEKRELVQCKDCKHWYKDTTDHTCIKTGDLRRGNFFCADGVREEGDAD